VLDIRQGALFIQLGCPCMDVIKGGPNRLWDISEVEFLNEDVETLLVEHKLCKVN